MPPQHEAMCVVRGSDGSWQLSALYRSGFNGVVGGATPATKVAKRKSARPAVFIDASMVCRLDDPDQLIGLAQWCMSAAIAMEQDSE